MLAGFRRLSVGIMWHRDVFIQRPVLRDVVVAGVECPPRLSERTVLPYKLSPTGHN
jgi:hypothetical protein